MRIQQQSHHRSQSRSKSLLIISPLMIMRPRNVPRRRFFSPFPTGSTRAIGSPRNVTVNGFPLFCTSFSILMHFALNSEISTVFISRREYLVKRLSQLPDRRQGVLAFTT